MTRYRLDPDPRQVILVSHGRTRHNTNIKFCFAHGVTPLVHLDFPNSIEVFFQEVNSYWTRLITVYLNFAVEELEKIARMSLY